MKKTAIAFTLLFPFLALAADPPKPGEMTDPVEILKKADAACKENKIAAYTASAKGRGADAEKAPTVTGKVIIAEYFNDAPKNFRIDAKVQRPGSADIQEFTAGGNGEKFFLIDSQAKKIYEDIDPQVLGQRGRPVRGLIMLELIHPKAFEDEYMRAEKQELREPAKIGNEDCYQVYVKYAQPNLEANWFLSKKDFLPRKVERIFPNQAGEKGGRELTITDLTVSPKVDDNTFKATVPEGFTKTDDFAP